MLSRIALRQLMAHAAGAGSLQAVYDAALRGVQEVLNVERASLLVFDASGTMRFVVWSGLSDAYRTAVDGHSPWSVDETAATSILFRLLARDRRVRNGSQSAASECYWWTTTAGSRNRWR